VGQKMQKNYNKDVGEASEEKVQNDINKNKDHYFEPTCIQQKCVTN
jgi:hypothetical protein